MFCLCYVHSIGYNKRFFFVQNHVLLDCFNIQMKRHKGKRLENQMSKKKKVTSKKENDLKVRIEETNAQTHAKYLDSLNEEIQARAHAIYLSHKGESGSPLSDWLQAEKEIQEAYGTRRDLFKKDPNG